MAEAKIHEIRQWLTKADHDLRSAEMLLNGKPPILDTSVYHCQQAAEKALKAYLTLHDVVFQKVHVLGILVEQCLECDDSFSELLEIADSLTPFAVAFRYPGNVLEPEVEEAEEAYRMAAFVVSFVRDKMPVEILTD